MAIQRWKLEDDSFQPGENDAELIFDQRFELVESFMVQDSKGALTYLTEGLIKKYGTKQKMECQDGSIDIPH